jgi:acetyl esterase/lipase
MPATRLDVIVKQIAAAALHLVAIAPGLGADPARFTVSGHSAGARLACYLAGHGLQEPARPPLPPVRGLFLVIGIYDLSGIPDSFLKSEAKMTAQEAEAWSPMTSDHDPMPRRIITRGEAETRTFHEQAEAMAVVGHERSHSGTAQGVGAQSSEHRPFIGRPDISAWATPFENGRVFPREDVYAAGMREWHRSDVCVESIRHPKSSLKQQGRKMQ